MNHKFTEIWKATDQKDRKILMFRTYKMVWLYENGSYFTAMNKVKEKEKGGEKQYYLNIQESKLCHSLFLSLNIYHWDQIGNDYTKCLLFMESTIPSKVFDLSSR